MVFDLQKFLDTPIYSLNQEALFSNVLSFLEFSERNIEWQKQVALLKAKKEAEDWDLEEPDRQSFYNHLRDTALFRFEVMLPMQTRYSALASLVGTIEWSMRFLQRRASFTVPKASDKQPEVIHLLNVFSKKSEFQCTDDISRLELLIQVRNCILHNSGFIEGYKYEAYTTARTIALTSQPTRRFMLYPRAFALRLATGETFPVESADHEHLVGLEPIRQKFRSSLGDQVEVLQLPGAKEWLNGEDHSSFYDFVCTIDDVRLLLVHPGADAVADERDRLAAPLRKRVGSVLVDVARARANTTALNRRTIDVAPDVIGAHLLLGWFAQDHGARLVTGVSEVYP